MEVREAQEGRELFGRGSLTATGGTQEESICGFAFGEHFAADGDKKLKFGSRNEVGIAGRSGKKSGHRKE